jgi:dTDP-4-dehydrorhamnose 3,5-epimerase
VRFEELPVPGLLLMRPVPSVDDRGAFMRVLSLDDLRERGLCTAFPQHSVAVNTKAGTVRGLHLQTAPYSEVKIVRCERGRLFDVMLDLREGSPTWGTWTSVVLDSVCGDSLYVPEGVAHGYQTLEDDTTVSYLISAGYEPSAATGVRWDDADLAIPWPRELTAISDRDRMLPTLAELRERWDIRTS